MMYNFEVYKIHLVLIIFKYLIIIMVIINYHQKILTIRKLLYQPFIKV